MKEADKASAKRPALGRGLSALLPGAPAPSTVNRGLLTVPVGDLTGEREQPRRYWNQQAIDELAASIKAKGIIQPILARRLPEGGLRIVAGERRWRAGIQAGLTEVPVIVKEISEADAFEVALIENIQREDLNPIEEAEAYHRLLGEHGLTQEQLAQRVGKERSTIANALRLLKLPGGVREWVASGSLSAGHAKALMGLGDAEEMGLLAGQVAQKGLSVRETERLVQRRKDPPQKKEREREPAPRELAALARKAEKGLGVPLELRMKSEEAGELVVRFASVAEGEQLLADILARLSPPAARESP